MNKFFELVAKDDEKEDGSPLKFDGVSMPFAIFLRKFKESMENQGFHEVFRGDNDDIPIRPIAVFHRLAGNDFYNPPQPGDQDIADAYENKKRIWDQKCQRVLGAFKRCLSKEVQEEIRDAGTDMTTVSKENILALIEATRAEYGSYKDGQAQLNYDLMRTIPSFKDVASTKSGLRKMSELIEEREGWRNAPELWTDNQKRQFLLNKMKDWPAIDFIHSTCDNDPQLTYGQCKLLLTRKIKKIQDAELVTSRLSREMANKASPLYSHSAQEVDQDSLNSSISGQLTGNSINQFNPVSYRNNNNRKRLKCYNCGVFDHFASECTASFCSRCWNDGLEYHHTVQKCPIYKVRNQTRAVMQTSQVQPQLQQSGQSSQKRSIQQAYSESVPQLQSRKMTLQPRVSNYPPRGTGVVDGQGSRGVGPSPQRRYTGSVADILAEVEHYDDDINQREVLQALMGAIQGQLSSSNEEITDDLPEDKDWSPNQS